MTTRGALTAATALFLALGAMPSGCGPRYSTLVVHNRTIAPISFVSLTNEVLYVDSCSTETFRWEGGWIDDTPVEPIPDALAVRISAAPPPDSVDDNVIVVSSKDLVSARPDASLPPCEGVPPRSLSLIVYNATTVPVRFVSGGATHYLDACLNWRYEWIDDRWTNQLTSETPIAGAALVAVDVTPQPAAHDDLTYVVITRNGVSVVDEDPRLGPGSCVGSPPSTPPS